MFHQDKNYSKKPQEISWKTSTHKEEGIFNLKFEAQRMARKTPEIALNLFFQIQ